MNSLSKCLFMMLLFHVLSSDGGLQEFMLIFLTTLALLTQNDRNYEARYYYCHYYLDSMMIFN